jgi:hypothetical protein
MTSQRTLVARSEALSHAIAAHLQRDEARIAAVARATPRRSGVNVVERAPDVAWGREGAMLDWAVRAVVVEAP